MLKTDVLSCLGVIISIFFKLSCTKLFVNVSAHVFSSVQLCLVLSLKEVNETLPVTIYFVLHYIPKNDAISKNKITELSLKSIFYLDVYVSFFLYDNLYVF
jgi:hypothetical protein